jgi:hypothetical protein
VTRRLRMMTDQNLAGMDAELNSRYPRKLKAISLFDVKMRDRTGDERLVQAGKEKRYILLTRDTRSINRKKRPFKPCTHYGIIKMPGMPSDEEVLERIDKLLKSGKRCLGQIVGHFTHLNADSAKIYKEHGEVVFVRFT